MRHFPSLSYHAIFFTIVLFLNPLNYPDRFKDESARRIHISKHIREKKARERNAEEERKAQGGCHKHTFEEKAKLLRMSRNKRSMSRSTVVRDNYRDGR